MAGRGPSPLSGSGDDPTDGCSSSHTSRTEKQSREDGLSPAQVRIKQDTTEFLHPIGADSFTVGKDAANALVMQDRFISSQHLQVTRREAVFHFRDLNSTNGTFLGDVRLFEAEIPLNTVLRVGETELVFEPAAQGQQEHFSHGLVGNDPSMRQLVGFLQRVAEVDPVFRTTPLFGFPADSTVGARHDAEKSEAV